MKRREIVRSAVFAGIASAASPSGAANEGMRDTRLIGVWRSDSERTAGLWRFRPSLAEPTRERITNMFGKLTLRFTEKRLVSEYEGQVTSDNRYRIVASDSRSVVVEYQGENGRMVEQLFIEGRYFYKHAGNDYNFEFFRRVEA